MKQKQRLVIAKILLFANAVLWLVFLGYNAMFMPDSVANNWYIRSIYLAESIAHMIILFGLYKWVKVSAVSGVVITGANSVLSIADQAGVFDWISFVLSFATCLILTTVFFSHKQN